MLPDILTEYIRTKFKTKLFKFEYTITFNNRQDGAGELSN